MNIKKLLSFGLSAVMALSLAACGSTAEADENEGTRSPNPFTEFQTLEEAESAAKFTLGLPQSIEGYQDPVFRLAKEIGLLEVIFENEDESITIRKASGDSDISGNYTEFSEENEVNIDGAAVTMKGADGKVNVAIWSKDGYAYSIDCTDAVDKDTISDFIKAVMADTAEPDGDRPPNPFTEFQTLEEAESAAKFTLGLPQSIEGYHGPVFRFAKEIGLLEVIFENEDESITIRKASGDSDISGNYTEFSEKNEVNIDGAAVTMKGADGKVNVAIWSKDGYAYSIDCTDAVDKVTISDFIKAVMADAAEPDGDRPPNPFIDCNDLEEAADKTGFSLVVPTAPDRVSVLEDASMIQAFYGEDGEDMLIRKAVGSEDISGDYNEYAQVETVNGVTLKGEDGQFALAIWKDGGYTFAVSVSEALSQTDMLALVASIK